MKLWLKNNLSKSEKCVATEPLACTDLDLMTLSSFLEVQTALSSVAGHTYLMVKQKRLGR